MPKVIVLQKKWFVCVFKRFLSKIEGNSFAKKDILIRKMEMVMLQIAFERFTHSVYKQAWDD